MTYALHMEDPVVRIYLRPVKTGLRVDSPAFVAAFARGLGWTPYSALCWDQSGPSTFDGRWKDAQWKTDVITEAWRDVSAAGETAMVHEQVGVGFRATIRSAQGSREVNDGEFYLEERAAFWASTRNPATT